MFLFLFCQWNPIGFDNEFEDLLEIAKLGFDPFHKIWMIHGCSINCLGHSKKQTDVVDISEN